MFKTVQYWCRLELHAHDVSCAPGLIHAYIDVSGLHRRLRLTSTSWVYIKVSVLCSLQKSLAHRRLRTLNYVTDGLPYNRDWTASELQHDPVS